MVLSFSAGHIKAMAAAVDIRQSPKILLHSHALFSLFSTSSNRLVSQSSAFLKLSCALVVLSEEFSPLDTVFFFHMILSFRDLFSLPC